MSENPTPEEQCKIIKNIEKESFSIGEKVCPISSAWFHNWKKYVNYDNDPESEQVTTEIGPIDNSKVIKNDQLARNIVESVDFDLLHKESYDLLHKWYSGGPTIKIEVISNSKGQPVVVTKYILFKICYISSEKVLEAHKYMKISEMHQKARQMYDVPESSTTRLFYLFNSKPAFIYKDDKTLEYYPFFQKENKVLLDYQKSDGTWYSDELKKSLSNTTTTVSQNNYNSSSFSSSVSGDTTGVVGFYNLGNTCFFNSGTQCLLHTVPLIKKFVCNDDWMDDLNYTNKIGMRGELAKAFADLAKEVWSGHSGTINPSNLKNVIGRFRDTFAGYEQQDSHELIYAMLDGIHEDLNRCTQRPILDPVEGDGTDDDETANEAWRRYKLVNNSIIVDLFDGLFRSRLWCPCCHSTTVVFDPYRSITMPIEQPHMKTLKVIYVPYNFSEERKTLTIEIRQSSNDFNEAASLQISRQLGRTVNVKLGSQIRKGFPLQWGIQTLFFNRFIIFAFEMPNVNYEDGDPLFTTCSIDIKPKDDSQGVLNVLTKMTIPFIVNVTDLPDNLDNDEGKALFEKRIEQRLHILWEERRDKENARDNEKERQRKEKENKLKEEKAKEANKEQDQAKTEEKKETEDEAKEEKNESDDKEKKESDDKEKEKLEKKESEDKEKEKHEEKESDDKEKERLEKKEGDDKEKEKEGEDKEKLEKKESDDKEKSKEESGDQKSNVAQVFKKKMDLSPPQGVTFSDPSQKLAVTFKMYQPKEFKKKPCKTSPYFTDAHALIHLNEDSNLSIQSLFRNIEMRSQKQQQQQPDSGILTLSKCFNFFSTPDVLDERNQWYCPKCKQFVCAEKKLDIWKLPEILIIQLKRFYGSGFAARKLDHFVDFPEILDMKEYVIGPQKEEAEIKYRLYAVSNQYGSLSGGHYTAAARVRDPNEPEKDKGWYNFDDSHVSRSSEASAHSAAAYVLFYERIYE